MGGVEGGGSKEREHGGEDGGIVEDKDKNGKKAESTSNRGYISLLSITSTVPRRWRFLG